MLKVGRKYRNCREFQVQGRCERENEESAVWKREFEEDSVVVRGGRWVETVRTYVGRSGLKAETGKACHD